MRNTTQYILKRLLYMIPMVLVITFLIYGGLELTPGDAISHMIPPDQLANVNPEQLEALRESYGLNDPFLLRYVRWLGELLHGNFGYSITSGVPIKDILLQLFPATLELSLAAPGHLLGAGQHPGHPQCAEEGVYWRQRADGVRHDRRLHPPVLLRYAVYPRLCAGLGDLADWRPAWRRERRGYGTTSNI